MEIIHNNPYRLLGLYANASEKELQKNRAKINAYLNTGKTLDFEQDFPFLPPIDRNIGAVESALSMLQLSPNRLTNALFWFARGNALDEAAFNHLKAGKPHKAINEWMKVTANDANLGQYHTSFNNLGTLILSLLFADSEVDKEDLIFAVQLKLKLILSDHFTEFVKLTTDSNYTPDKYEVAGDFSDLIIEQLNRTCGATQFTNALITRLSEMMPPDIKKRILLQQINQPLDELHELIKETRTKREAIPAEGINYGNQLVVNSSTLILELAALLGANDIQYQMLADKLADEILQCAIDSFHEFADKSDFDPTSQVVPLMEKAQKLTVGGRVKQRIEQNLEEINNWIKETPMRDKHAMIKDDIAQISEEIKNFQNETPNLATAYRFAQTCKQYLDLIRNAVGKDEVLYLEVSSAVVNNALSMAIMYVNQVAESVDLENTVRLSAEERALWIKANLDASKLLLYLQDFDVSEEQREHLEQNYSIICSNALIPESPRSGNLGSSNSMPEESDTSSAPADRKNLNWFWIIVGLIVWIFIMSQCH